jgi:hypothetical protein
VISSHGWVVTRASTAEPFDTTCESLSPSSPRCADPMDGVPRGIRIGFWRSEITECGCGLRLTSHEDGSESRYRSNPSGAVAFRAAERSYGNLTAPRESVGAESKSQRVGSTRGIRAQIWAPSGCRNDVESMLLSQPEHPETPGAGWVLLERFPDSSSGLVSSSVRRVTPSAYPTAAYATHTFPGDGRCWG